jgi:hypothetical protein
MMVTVAPGTVLPSGSTTVPLMDALVVLGQGGTGERERGQKGSDHDKRAQCAGSNAEHATSYSELSVWEGYACFLPRSRY